MYELEVPPNTKPGSKLKLTIPGMPEKVVITVPEGAEPGRTISFTLPKNKSSVEAKLTEQTKAATVLQSRIRGKAARQVTSSKIALASEPELKAAAPPPPPPAEPTYEPNFAEKAPPVEAAAAPKKEEELGFLGGLFKAVGNLFGGGDAPAEPSVDAASAMAFELSALTATAITAWETADFDTFASIASADVTVSLPGASASGMTGVWSTREAEEVEGLLSIDTVMAQVEDDACTVATVVAIEHSHETEAHGMPLKHAWLRMSFKRAAPAEGAPPPPWQIVELMRDPIWPLPTEKDAAPEDFRLGQGRTLGACTDVASLTAVALTSYVAGDRDRFQLAVADSLRVTFKALGLESVGVPAAWEGRANLLRVGNLLSVNSPMVDTDGKGNSSVLAHAHLYDVGAGESSGRPTAHFALRLDFVGATLHALVGDVIWMDEEYAAEEYETEGLAFDHPPVQSIYTRALTFVKAWETQSEESLRALTSPSVELSVPRYKVEGADIEALLKYRATLATVGMLTVDSVRVSGARFEAYLHEYGVDVTQHGLPRMHAGLVLEFGLDDASKEMKVSRMALDVEYAPVMRRQSTFKEVGAEVVTTASL